MQKTSSRAISPSPGDGEIARFTQSPASVSPRSTPPASSPTFTGNPHCLKKIYIDDILKPFRPCSFDNGMYVAMTLKDYKIPESIAKEGSFLYYYDSDFNIIGSIADNKDRTHRNIEGVTTFPRLKEILSQSGSSEIFKMYLLACSSMYKEGIILDTLAEDTCSPSPRIRIVWPSSIPAGILTLTFTL